AVGELEPLDAGELVDVSLAALLEGGLVRRKTQTFLTLKRVRLGDEVQEPYSTGGIERVVPRLPRYRHRHEKRSHDRERELRAVRIRVHFSPFLSRRRILECV